MTRIAVVGCGAIAESFHLPALARMRPQGVEVLLVDPDPTRARLAGSAHGFTEVAESHQDVLTRVDAAIIASPHETHVPITLAFVEAGIPVLCEKPLGTSTDQVERVVEASRRNDVTVAVNHTRRFIPACREIHRHIAAGSLGEIFAVEAVEGDRFGWPAATPSLFGSRSGGKGVLLDIGVHVLDLLTWWFGPDMDVASYHDDSFGGSETTAHVALTRGNLNLSIRLSWLVKQRNAYRIVGREATLDWAIYDLDRLSITSKSTGRTSRIALRGGPREYGDLADQVIANFLEAIAGTAPPRATPDDALASMRLIETCYQNRKRFDMPWHMPQFETSHAS